MLSLLGFVFKLLGVVFIFVVMLPAVIAFLIPILGVVAIVVVCVFGLVFVYKAVFKGGDISS
jgi:hypothetical protein